MDLRRLRYFVAVADHGGFSAAARALFVAQPAVSSAVQALEAELGTRLFARLGRRVTLTPAGEALLGPARQTLRDVETARAAVDAVRGLRAGSLTVGCLPTLAADPLADLLGRFRRAAPGVGIELVTAQDTDEVVQQLRSGRCEVGVAEPAVGDVVGDDLAPQRMAVVFPPGTDRPGRLTLPELAGVPLVAGPSGTSAREVVEEGFAAAGVRPAVAVVTTQRDAIIPLVLAGAGAAVVPEPVAETAAALGAVWASTEPVLTRRVALLRRPGPLAPAAARFVDLALGAA